MDLESRVGLRMRSGLIKGDFDRSSTEGKRKRRSRNAGGVYAVVHEIL